MAKATKTQRDFTLGALREGFLEGDDLELRGRSLRAGLNVRVEATRSLAGRPGMSYRRDKVGAYDIVELRVDSGEVYGLLIGDGKLDIIDDVARSVATFNGPWATGADVYIEPFGSEVVIGGSWGIKVLKWFPGGGWQFSNLSFSAAAGGEVAQPYWVFNKGVTLRPSDTTGTVTLTASDRVFTSAHVGTRVRYGGREIIITEYNSPFALRGTVVSQLPPSFQLTLASTSNLRVGDAVVGTESQYEGITVAISGKQASVVTVSNFGGPKDNEVMSFPAGSSRVTAIEEIPPVASTIWDEQLISPVHGYPRACASAGGRLTFVDFPEVPDLICMSSSRGIRDFETGVDDDDAIVRQVGENTPRFLHVVNSGDLILFSDAGIYYIDLRSGDPVTPTNFSPVRFDRRSAAPVRPVPVEDGVVFVEANLQSIGACILTGNVNLRWTVRTISIYHNQLIDRPVKLCGPSIFSTTPEKYLFVVNEDGTLAAMSWFEEFSLETIGFLKWQTQGAFRSISPIFGGYWAIVDREIAGAARRTIEALDDAVHLDCTCGLSTPGMLRLNSADLEVNGVSLEVASTASLPLAGQTVLIAGAGWFGGEVQVGVDGTIDGEFPNDAYVGLDFPVSVTPWPVEHIDHPRAGMLRARLIRGGVSVQSTLTVDIRANNHSRTFGGYGFGDDLSAANLMTKVLKFSVTGNRDHPEIEISRSAPGPFRILAVTQEVQT